MTQASKEPGDLGVLGLYRGTPISYEFPLIKVKVQRGLAPLLWSSAQGVTLRAAYLKKSVGSSEEWEPVGSSQTGQPSKHMRHW